MNNIAKRIANLSSEKQKLFFQRLKEMQVAQPLAHSALPAVAPDLKQRYQPFSLTDIQQVYWTGRSGFFDLGSYGTNVYIEIEISGEGEQVLSRLNSAVRRLIERHDMLRVIITSDVQQRILPHVPPYEIDVVDLRERDSQLVETELKKVRERMRTKKGVFDRQPLFDFLAYWLDDQRIRFLARIDTLLIDGSSHVIFVQELSELVQNPETSLPSLEYSYRDYVVSWMALQTSELYCRSREYWLSRLPALPSAPELPLVQHISPLTPSQFVIRIAPLLEANVWQRLKALAARSGLTPSSLVTAAFVEVLGAWSSNTCFTIGLVGSYRPPIHPDIDKILGNFNTLYLLEVGKPTGTFEARARGLQKQMVTDLEHRYFSGLQVLQEMNRTRGGSSRAIMPILFNSILEYNHPKYQHEKEGNARANDTNTAFTFKEIEVDVNIAQVLLAVNVGEGDHGDLLYRCQAVEELLPDGLILDILGAYMHFLRCLANEEAAWYELGRKLVPPTQIQQRVAINATKAPIPTELLHTAFAAQVPLRPHHAAVVSSNRLLTYQELYFCSNKVGHLLHDLGVRPNTLVAVVMEKGWEQVVAVLGILQSGAAYLPIDPGVPKERLWYFLEQGEVDMVLTQSWLDESLEWPESVARFCIDYEDKFSDASHHPLESVQNPGDLAYVIYTSAYGDQPKGAMISHRSALNTIHAINYRFNVMFEDRVLALSPLDCDLSVYDIFGTLAAGGTIIIPTSLAMRDPSHWAKMAPQHRITIWNSTPALLELLVANVIAHPDGALDSLRLALISKDWLPLTLPDQLKSLVENIQLISLVGTTETSIWSTLYPITDINPTWKSIPYGQPLINQRIYILNEMLEPCPDWVPGEIHIGGIGLAKGYWKDGEKTQSAFVHHPQIGERLFKTGDMGRFLPDGTIELLGQKKDWRVEIHGYVIELRQIEAILEQHPDIRGAITRSWEDEFGKKYLVAYLVASQQAGVSADSVRFYLKERLPDYMVPDAFIILESLPLTSSGKVDRYMLPRPEQTCAKSEQRFATSPGTIEYQLAQLWKEILNIHTVGITDNFFDLGGTSFLAAHLLTRIQKLFNRDLSLSTFFQGKATIEDLVGILQHGP